MPPAFNLSQDQTLQFDLCKLTHLNVGPAPQRFRQRDKTFSLPAISGEKASLRCASTSFVLDLPCRFAIPRLPGKQPTARPQTTSTHTYRLQIVKERSACDSARLNLRTGKDAAERRDNRMNFRVCQHPVTPRPPTLARCEAFQARPLKSTVQRTRGDNLTQPSTMPAPGRNAPCPCGSGKRFKDCHGRTDAHEAGTAPAPVELARAGMAAHQRNDLDAAEQLYRAALAVEPDQPLALHYLGVALYQRGSIDDAMPLLDRAIALVPNEPEFHNNRGLALAARLQDDLAVAAFQRALALKPLHAGAWNNLGLALQALGDTAGAVDAFRHALAIAPDHPQAHWNLGLALLVAGDLADGWKEYEWRLRAPELGPFIRQWPVPRWQGEDIAGKTILLHAEQGLGDTLQNIRFADAVAARGARVIAAVQAPLLRLVATAPGVSFTVGPTAPMPAFDMHVPLMSLPFVLGATAEHLRVAIPYLRSDPTRRQEAAAHVAQRASRSLRVGVAWSGATGTHYNLRRACPLDVLAPMFRLPRTCWFSLQKDSAEIGAERPRATAVHPLIELDLRNDFDGTAALIDVLDVIVTVDTSMAHLAGALGKPVLLLLPSAPDWRWGMAGDDTPWYPTARLFRQRTAGDWLEPVARIESALTLLTATLQLPQ